MIHNLLCVVATLDLMSLLLRFLLRRYKLMHTYDSSIYGNWFNYEDTLENDDSLAEGTCNQALAMSGEFTVRTSNQVSCIFVNCHDC
jgi:hypothetical protein